MKRGIDRLEVVELRLTMEQQQSLAGEQSGESGDGSRAAPASAGEDRAGGQWHQQARYQQEGMDHEHQSEGQQGAGARPRQIVAVDATNLPGVQHEAEA